MKDTTIAKIVFLACLLAAMFWPERGRAQPEILGTMNAVPNAEIQIGINRGDITASHTYYWEIDTDTVGIGTTKRDTVLVDALCINSRDKRGVFDRNGNVLGVEVYWNRLYQERTFEWDCCVPDKTSMVMFEHRTYSDWVLKSTRWLDPIDGCYQLVPLED